MIKQRRVPMKPLTSNRGQDMPFRVVATIRFFRNDFAGLHMTTRPAGGTAPGT